MAVGKPPYTDAMAISRSLRRTNPITIILSIVLAVGLLFFLLSPSSPAIPIPSPTQQHNSPASNPLSPATAPFRKQVDSNGKRTPPPVVSYKLNNLTTSADPIKNRETVLILTPLARFYQGYWDNILSLTYPHDLIALGFITPKTREGNSATAALQAAITQTQSGPEAKRFASITILRQDFEPPLASQDEAERHKMENQRARRSAMSRARNSLLFTTIGPGTAWVLWLDADVVETPASLIQDLAAHDKPIIVPNCLQRYTNDQGKPDVRGYDFNSWQDSSEAAAIAKKMSPDDILLEGYGEMATYRKLMAKIADTSEGRDQTIIMPLDGVGGTALLVKAEVHRDGAMFPPFAFYHLMETEGFAKMARRLGWSCWGLPNYFVSLNFCWIMSLWIGH